MPDQPPPAAAQSRHPSHKSASRLWKKAKEQSLKIENLEEQSPKKKELTKDQVNKLVERALENAKLKKEAEEAENEQVVRKKKSHLIEDLKVYFAVAILLLVAGGIIVAKSTWNQAP